MAIGRLFISIMNGLAFFVFCGVLGHTDKFCSMLFQKGVDAVKREWGIRLKASARRLEDTVGERWLQD